MSKQGYIYLCRNHRNGYTKIGYSIQPSYREKALQSEEPEVSFIALLPGGMNMERELHGRFHEKRLRGEWFDLSKDEVAGIISTLSPLGEEFDWGRFHDIWHDPEDPCGEGTPLIPLEIGNLFE